MAATPGTRVWTVQVIGLNTEADRKVSECNFCCRFSVSPIYEVHIWCTDEGPRS
jgi:hypothetical protein